MFVDIDRALYSRQKSQNFNNSSLKPFRDDIILPATNLTLRKRRHPRHHDIKPNHHTSHNPETLRIVRPMESEQNSKDYSTKVSHGTHCSTQNAVRVGVHVWYQSEIGAIACFKEESHTGDQPEHCRLVVWVEEADGDEEGACGYADEDNPAFLQPEVCGDVFVEEVADDAS
jgi:hypothetical protein